MSWRTIRLAAISLFTASIVAYAVLFLACLDCRAEPQVKSTKAIQDFKSESESTLPPYIGCQAFTEPPPPPPLTYLAERANNVTVSSCLSVCYRSDYEFALLLGGDTCYCSSFSGTGAPQTEDRCGSPCSGNSSQICGGTASVSVYSLGMRNGIQEWTTWMTMEASNLHKRFRGCFVDGNSTCSIQSETKTSGDLEEWEKDLRPHFIGCFTTASIISTAVKTIVPTNDWPSNARECISHCWWSLVPYASLVTRGSDRVCVCTPTLANSIPVNTCMDMYGAQVFVLYSFGQADKLQFSAASAQRKVLLLGYLQRNLAYVHAIFKSQPQAFYTHDMDSLLKASSELRDENGSSAPAAAAAATGLSGRSSSGSSSGLEAVVPVHEVLHPYYHCNVYRMSSMFLQWKQTRASHNSGYINYISCTKMVYGDLGYAKCLPFLEESCKTSSLVVGTASTFLNQFNLEWFIWHNSDVHIIHVIRDPLRILLPEDQMGLKGHNVTALVQRLCSQVLATNDHFQKQIWTKRLHTLFYEETASSASKVIAFAARKMAWNLSDTTVTGDHTSLTGGLEDANESNEAATLPLSLLTDTANPVVGELGRQQCALFYKKFPKRYRAPGDLPADRNSPSQAYQPPNKRAVQPNQLLQQQQRRARAAADRAKMVKRWQPNG